MIRLHINRNKLDEMEKSYSTIVQKGPDSFSKLNSNYASTINEGITAVQVNNTISIIMADYPPLNPINVSGLENLYDSHRDLKAATQNVYLDEFQKDGKTLSKFKKFQMKLINRDNWISLKTKGINSFFYYNTYHQFNLIKTAKLYGYTSGVFGWMPYFAISTAASGVFYIAEFYAPVGKVKHVLHAGYLLTSAPNIALLGCSNLVFRGAERWITGSSLPGTAGELLGLAPSDVKANQWIYKKIAKITGSAVYKRTSGKIGYIFKNWDKIGEE